MSEVFGPPTVRPGLEVGCFYRWPYDGCHPGCWLPPHKGVVLAINDPRAWAKTLFSPQGEPEQAKLDKHIERCLSEGLLMDKFPVLWSWTEGAGTGQGVQWDFTDKLLPYDEMVVEWEKARDERFAELENARKERIKEIRAEIRQNKREMKEKGIKRTSCFNGGHSSESYSYNATLFRLETLLKDLEKP